MVPQQQARPSFLSLTPQQLRRRSLYAAAQPFKPALVSSIRKSSVAPAQRQAWVERELQAITLEDEVKVVSQVVLRTVTALEKSMSTQGTRYST